MSQLKSKNAARRAGKRHPSGGRRRLMLEPLERRMMLSATKMPSIDGSTLPDGGDDSIAVAATVDLAPAKDNTLYQDQAGFVSNGRGHHFFAGRTVEAEDALRRGLVAFDIAGVARGRVRDWIGFALCGHDCPKNLNRRLQYFLVRR